ncbi:MAG: hypothetical protein NC212_06380 [Staphylococcus sp.]|nr:hypothetical protein [Staphylococcus sp.]
MKNRLIVSLVTLFISSFFMLSGVRADDKGEEKITLNTGKNDDLIIPKAPAYIPVSCYFDGENIIIVSENSIMGLVTITDGISGSEIASDGGCFNPEMVVPLNGFKGYVVITINIGSVTYIGETLI